MVSRRSGAREMGAPYVGTYQILTLLCWGDFVLFISLLHNLQWTFLPFTLLSAPGQQAVLTESWPDFDRLANLQLYLQHTQEARFKQPCEPQHVVHYRG